MCSPPGYAYDSVLLKAQQELEVLSSPNVYHCIQNNLRGGFTSVARRFVRANNIYTNPSLIQNMKEVYFFLILTSTVFILCSATMVIIQKFYLLRFPLIHG